MRRRSVTNCKIVGLSPIVNSGDPITNGSGQPIRRNAILITLDFGDDQNFVGGSASDISSFLDFVFAHEVSHFFPTAKHDSSQKFEGTVATIKDENGNEIYKEATITLYTSNIGDYKNHDPDDIDAEMTATFSHEAEHDLDLKQVQTAKLNRGGDGSIWHPQTLYKKENDTRQEVRAVQIYNREQFLNNLCLPPKP